MSGDLITLNQSAAKRAKEQLSSLLKNPSLREDLMLPSARQKLQTLDTEPSVNEIADVLLGIGE